jgi:hypothetical protein
MHFVLTGRQRIRLLHGLSKAQDKLLKGKSAA